MSEAQLPAPAAREPQRDTGGDPAGALLDALFSDASVGLGFWDRDLRYRRVNDRLAAMNGVPAQDHLGLRPSEVLPALGPGVESGLRRVLESGEPLRDLDIEGETPAAPGVLRHWRATYLPVRDGAGDLVGLAALVVEVTGERRALVRADSALQQSAFVDAELRALYAALPVGVAFLGPDLRYQRVNETLARLNGRSVGEHVGASLEDVLGGHAPHLRAALVEVLATRRPLELELSVPVGGDPADVRALEATYFPVVGDGGQLLGVGATVHDVTDRHALEVEQKRLLREALVARARAEASGVRADDAREEAERTAAEAERGRARMALLAEAGRRMAESMDWESTLRTVVRSVVPGMADWSSLSVVEPSGALRMVALAHADPERERLGRELYDRYPPADDGGAGSAAAVRTGEMQVLTDIPPDMLRAAAHDAEHLRLLEGLDLRHVAIAPLRAPHGVIGALSFVLGESGRRFADEDLQLVRSLAARAALHIENARLYTERSAIAQTLQRSLRPPALPDIAGAELAAQYLPAGDQNTVGGDFYDVFRTGRGIWTAVVGDVSGKGAPAAALTALARYSLRMTSRLHENPSANLTLLNQAFVEDAGRQDFCTAVYAQVRPADDGLDVRFANGGHLPPLVLRGDGRVEAIHSGRGPLLGFVAGAAYTQDTLRLAPGELLLLYTDGVTEVRTSDASLGDRELRSTLAAHAGAPAADVVDAVSRRARELQGGSARDDIALLAIRAVGTAAPGAAPG